MHGLEVDDPYVERLLEGVGFLAARVQLKLDAEFPRFTQALLDIIYPHYLAPTPSMLVAQMLPDKNEPGLARAREPSRVDRRMHSLARPRRCDGVRVPYGAGRDPLPVEISSASYFSFAPDLPLNMLPVAQRIKGGLRIRLRTTAGLKFSQTRSIGCVSISRGATMWRTRCSSCALPQVSVCWSGRRPERRRTTSSCRRRRLSRSVSPTATRFCRSRCVRSRAIG